MTETHHVVLIPMLLTAYQCQETSEQNAWNELMTAHHAYRAAAIPPDLRGLQLDGDFIKHDIFEHLDVPQFGFFDLDTETPDRSGIKIHWSIPRHYRTAITASESSDASAKIHKIARSGGYGEVLNSQALTYREVPNRWIIVRRVEANIVADGLSNALSIGLLKGEGKYKYSTIDEPQYTVFVVEGDAVRHIDSIDPEEDISLTTAPFIKIDSPLHDQGKYFLGKAVPITEWLGEGKTSPDISSRATVTVAQAANPFFADYQPYNSSVFSFFDGLDMDAEPEDEFRVISSGIISYTIIGYHSAPDKDPLSAKDNPDAQTNRERLAACLMNMKDPSILSTEDLQWLNGPAGENNVSLCHGSLFNINYSHSVSKENALKVQADILQKEFSISQPLAVGANALDALYGWIRVQADSVLEPSTLRNTLRLLLKLQTLVHDVDENLDSQIQASDLVATNNFISSSGGTHWHLKASIADGGQTTLPSKPVRDSLHSLNLSQSRYDYLCRLIERRRVELFNLWWTFVVDRRKGSSSDRVDLQIGIQRRVRDLLTELRPILMKEQGHKEWLKKEAKEIGAEAGTKPPFYMQRDPTILFAGVKSGWPVGFNESLDVRFDGQQLEGLTSVPPMDPRAVPAEINDGIGAQLRDKIRPEVLRPLLRLITEANQLRENQSGRIPPEYYPGGHFAEGQGWFPLFIEWEVEFYNIPFKYWQFGLGAPKDQQNRFTYHVDPGLKLSSVPEVQGDFHVYHGRSPVLPQTSASLEVVLKQIFSKMNSQELDSCISSTERSALLENIRSLDYLTASMTGLTDQLTTRMKGAHINPFSLSADVSPTAVQQMRDISHVLGIQDEELEIVNFLTKSTPFASSVPVAADPTRFSPFKSCTHGQFRFRKLSIVDRFNQIVQAQTWKVDSEAGIAKPVPVLPCVGEIFAIPPLADSLPNSVLPRTDDICPFVQVPPRINQPARVNADLLVEDIDIDSKPILRQANEWENPVDGYIVLNYAMQTIAIFSPEGHFVREYDMNTSKVAVRPFPANEKVAAAQNPLLKALLTALQSETYCKGFLKTLLDASQTVRAHPTAYSGSILSTVGRLFALTKVGISLELADEPLHNLSTIAPTKPDIEENLLTYEFGVKLGDGDKLFDGLLGYFEAFDASTSKPGNRFDLSAFYSESATISAGSPSRPSPSHFKLNPHFEIQAPMEEPQTAAFPLSKRTHKLIACVVDAFTPVHVYTSLLPTVKLQLPPWAVDQVVTLTRPFLKLGPLLIQSDVPQYDKAKDVPINYQLDAEDDTKPVSNGDIQLPVTGLAEWTWLQPYKEGENPTSYNALDIKTEPKASKPDWEHKPPYTVVEGYLQMKKPLEKPQHQEALQ